MRIKKVRIKNFRSYREEVSIDINDLTTFVGKNDIGKSTVLDALDIFFNEGKGSVKLDKDDINKTGLTEGDNEIIISVVFEDLPNTLIIDSSNETNLTSEFLQNQDDELEVIKVFPNAGKEKVVIRAYHPTRIECKDLLLKKITELKSILDEHSIECIDRTKSAVIRQSIWNHFRSDLQRNILDIDVTKEDAKKIWDKLKSYLPLYSLFQSDRKNSDSDSEVQDPLQYAVQEILRDEDLIRRLNQVANEVEEKLRIVANNTLEKLNEMNPEIANSLYPVIPPSDSLKWTDVFKKVSIAGDDEIPINKRGSGVKRLILLNFFRAEAERRRQEENFTSVVFAIEEPETAQHTDHQKKLIQALVELASFENTQILLTTHSPTIVKELEFENLRLIKKTDNIKNIIPIQQSQLPYPSLNEVNYVAFDEITPEYHNELFGFIESEGQMANYNNGKPKRLYIRQRQNGSTLKEQKNLTEYIRHQIHHPENAHNIRFTGIELKESIDLMRDFILALSN